LVILIGAVRVAAQSSAPSPIITDRPAVTDSSVVVPADTLQGENGFAVTTSQGQNTFDGPKSLFRFGVASKTELRLITPDYFGVAVSGLGDLAIGMKQQLGPAPGGFDVSVVLATSLPTGANTISSHGYDPFVQIPWSRALSANWTAAGMLSVYSPTQAGQHNVTGETAFLIDRTLTKTWDAFIEYAGDFPERGGPRHLLHFGTAFRVTSNQQIDFHAGAGLSSATADHFIAAGYSFRVRVFRR